MSLAFLICQATKGGACPTCTAARHRQRQFPVNTQLSPGPRVFVPQPHRMTTVASHASKGMRVILVQNVVTSQCFEMALVLNVTAAVRQADAVKHAYVCLAVCQRHRRGCRSVLALANSEATCFRMPKA